MMKQFKKIFRISFFVALTAILSCQEDEPELGTFYVPDGLTINATISEDGSGLVTFKASAENAMNYHFYYGNSTSEDPYVSNDGVASNNYKKTGTNDYLVKVVAFGKGGISSSKTQEISVFVDFKVPEEMVTFLTNNNAKKWYWKQEVGGHLGVGPQTDGDGNVVSDPIYYQASPNEKESECLYEDELTFIDNGDGTFSYTLDNKGNTYFHTDEILDAQGVPSPGGDTCFPYDTSGTKGVLFSPSNTGVNPSTNVTMEFSNDGFMSYFVGNNTYEIMSITNTEMRVRVIQKRNGLAWYHTFTSVKGGTPPPTVDITYTNLIWSDEFDTDGAPNAANWTYDLGTGSGGWGNGESQYYTDRTDNVTVADGLLKITAKAENFSGASYTSTRLKSQGLFDFKYGRIDVRAKLPEGGGTWPAIWMLGANFETVGWPTCGEIDIMEHVGNDQNTIHGAIHNLSSSGATVNSGTKNISDASSAFHIYSVNWSANEISFLIDDEIYYTYNPSVKDTSTWPFDANQFIILNVAMGGSFGGAIDANFTSSTMEIDYVKVYQ